MARTPRSGTPLTGSIAPADTSHQEQRNPGRDQDDGTTDSVTGKNRRDIQAKTLLCGFFVAGHWLVKMTMAAATTEDRELLRRFADLRAEDAFAELVSRHIGLVHSAALRQVGGSPASAADVTQAVFIELAQQADRLKQHTALVGWLYTTTHRMAARHVRSEMRRQRREQEARAMQELHHDPEPVPDWPRLRPVLDAAMHDLAEADRIAVLLRHFEQRPYAEVGARIGLSENAARMRVDRALNKLRAKLAKRGVTSTSSALALALAGQAVTAAPMTLAASVTTTALAATGTTSSALGILTLMASTQLKIAVAVAGLAVASGAFVLKSQTAARLRADNADLQRRVAELTDDAQTLRQTIAGNVESLARANEPSVELLRLRGEVARLRSIKSQPTTANSGSSSKPSLKEVQTSAEHTITDMGTETPENTSTSLVYAVTAQNKDRFVELVKLPTDLSAAEAAENYDRLFRQMTNAYGRRQFGSVQRTKVNDDGTLKLYFGYRDIDTGREDELLVFLRRYDSGWKVVVDDIPRENTTGIGTTP